MLTTFELDEYVYEAVRAGASGFLLKRTPPEDLIAGLRVVASGDALLAPSVTRRLMSEFARATADGPAATDVSNRRRDTIQTHVKHILMKLALRDGVHAVVFAYETGLLEPGPSGR